VPAGNRGAIFEIIQRLVAEGQWSQLPAHLPQLTYIAIAPFTGAQETIELVEALKEMSSGAAQRAWSGWRAVMSGGLQAHPLEQEIDSHQPRARYDTRGGL
jgi:hypothetical protein